MSLAPAAGTLLVAAPSLLDPNFRRSVVLLCDHGPLSTMGLVVNRPLQVGVGQIFPNFSGADPHPPTSVEPSQCVYCGGPVETQRLLVLRRCPPAGEETLYHSFMDDVALVTDIDQALDCESEVALADHRFFLGYSGWGEGQLDQELSEDAWVVCPATERLLFFTAPTEIWSAALQSMGGIYSLWASMPVDPNLN